MTTSQKIKDEEFSDEINKIFGEKSE